MKKFILFPLFFVANAFAMDCPSGFLGIGGSETHTYSVRAVAGEELIPSSVFKIRARNGGVNVFLSGRLKATIRHNEFDYVPAGVGLGVLKEGDKLQVKGNGCYVVEFGEKRDGRFFGSPVQPSGGQKQQQPKSGQDPSLKEVPLAGDKQLPQPNPNNQGQQQGDEETVKPVNEVPQVSGGQGGGGRIGFPRTGKLFQKCTDEGLYMTGMGKKFPSRTDRIVKITVGNRIVTADSLTLSGPLRLDFWRGNKHIFAREIESFVDDDGLGFIRESSGKPRFAHIELLPNDEVTVTLPPGVSMSMQGHGNIWGHSVALCAKVKERPIR